jgi:hypothetical protein
LSSSVPTEVNVEGLKEKPDFGKSCLTGKKALCCKIERVTEKPKKSFIQTAIDKVKDTLGR